MSNDAYNAGRSTVRAVREMIRVDATSAAQAQAQVNGTGPYLNNDPAESGFVDVGAATGAVFVLGLSALDDGAGLG